MATIFTGAKCGCKRGVQRDNCPACEGAGRVIDFRAIRELREKKIVSDHSDKRANNGKV